jgi:predicted RNA-binding protein with PIN domain
MPLLIDGYNLLHGSGVFGERGRTPLEASRNALLEFIVAAVEPRELAGSAIVFDAQSAPPGLPRGYSYQGLAVHFAPRDRDADDVLEELIAAATVPRRLTVVSSDHRVQRAAKRRKATAIDSDRWYAETVAAWRLRRKQPAPQPPEGGTPADMTPTSAEVQRWLREFGLTEDDVAELEAELEPRRDESLEPPLAPQPPAPHKPPRKKAAAKAEPARRAKKAAPRARKKPAPRRKLSAEEVRRLDLRNPFPPGYGHDLLEE